MIIKKHNPTSPGRRGYVSVVDDELYKGRPYSKLIIVKKSTGGRNNLGRVTAWHRGGGHKKYYRIIDWKRDKDDISAKVIRKEYDPNRTSYIFLLLYADGEKRYILSPKNLKINDIIVSGDSSPISVGNCLPLNKIPVGTVIHCIEMKPNGGAKIARSAGCSAQLLALDGKYATLRLRSGEMRKIFSSCRATIGEVGKSEHNLQKLGKAGRSRWKNIRPRVRGVAMNPVDHPLGGGEGRTSGGRHPCSPWGLVDGKKTRNPRKVSSKFIVKFRKRKTDRR
ncbi:MAG: 50S ribosomal protein L2 [Candidatus Azosocius agrarius]|nr:MAG: 50S ribosomal protein L2 [Gammaproteobacteria bacterium]